jgi:hypothetical protein
MVATHEAGHLTLGVATNQGHLTFDGRSCEKVRVLMLDANDLLFLRDLKISVEIGAASSE